MPDLTFAQKKALSQPPAKVKEPDWWDQTKGFASAVPVGLTDLPLTVSDYGARATDALGMTDNAAPAVRKAFDDFNRELFPAAFNGTTGASAGRWLGQNLAPLPQVKIAAAAGRLIPAAAKLTGLPRQMADGAVNGAIGATLTSSADDRPLYEQAATGALGGAALGAAFYGAGSIIAPRIAPSRKPLLEQDHPLTIGQAMGGKVERLENKAAAWPVIGAPIRAAQERGMESIYPGLMKTLNESGNDAFSDLRPFPRPVAIDRGATGFMADVAYSQPVQTALRTVVGGERPQAAGIIGEYLRGNVGKRAALSGLLGKAR